MAYVQKTDFWKPETRTRTRLEKFRGTRTRRVQGVPGFWTPYLQLHYFLYFSGPGIPSSIPGWKCTGVVSTEFWLCLYQKNSAKHHDYFQWRRGSLWALVHSRLQQCAQANVCDTPKRWKNKALLQRRRLCHFWKAETRSWRIKGQNPGRSRCKLIN